MTGAGGRAMNTHRGPARSPLDERKRARRRKRSGRYPTHRAA